MDYSGIAVVETKWWKHTNTSIRGLFELISYFGYGTSEAYHYEMAMSGTAFKEAIPRIARDRKCRYLYVAAHGAASHLEFFNGDKISQSVIRNTFYKINYTPMSKLVGLHLGSCLIGTESFADYMFEHEIGLKWIVGYSKSVDWIDSSALDYLFFNKLIWAEGTENEKIRSTANELRFKVPGLVGDLGFGIYIRKRGGGIVNLLEK